MSKTIVVQEVINLLSITLSPDITSNKADEIVSSCVRLLKDEYNQLTH